MEKNERLRKAYEYLRNRGLAHTQKDVATKMGATAPNVSGALKGDVKLLTNKFLCRFNEAFGNIFNLNWLMTGEGDMMSGAPIAAGEGAAAQNDAPADMPAHTIRYYPNVYGLMGGAEFLDAPNEKVQPINLPGFWDCEIAINAYGDSMVPSIRSGQIVLCAEWKERYIEWGNIYLVITRGGRRCIKRVYPAADESAIECRSDNANYLPFTVPKEDIVKLYLVRGWICRETI